MGRESLGDSVQDQVKDDTYQGDGKEQARPLRLDLLISDGCQGLCRFPAASKALAAEVAAVKSLRRWERSALNRKGYGSVRS